MALLACVLLLAGIVAGCTQGGSGETGSTVTDDQKAMLEAVAKWHVAQGAVDLAGYKAGVYDPEDILGIATMTTPPPDAEKYDVKWAWSGDKIVLSIPSESTTITLSAPADKPGVVSLMDTFGQSATYVMKKDGAVWKIDIAKTQEAAKAQAMEATEPESSTAETPAP